MLNGIKKQQNAEKNRPIGPISRRNEEMVLEGLELHLLFIEKEYPNSLENDIETLKRDDLS